METTWHRNGDPPHEHTSSGLNSLPAAYIFLHCVTPTHSLLFVWFPVFYTPVQLCTKTSCSLQQHAVSCQYSVTLCSNWCSPSLASLKQNKQKISIKNIYLFPNNTHGNFTQTNTHTKQQNARLILRISPLLLFMENNHGRI